MKKLCFAVMAMCMLLSCGGKNEKEAATEEATLSGLMKSDFVSEVDGKPTALYVLKNKKGAEACVTNWGGRLVLTVWKACYRQVQTQTTERTLLLMKSRTGIMQI